VLERDNNSKFGAQDLQASAALEAAPPALTYAALLESLRESPSGADAGSVDSAVSRNRRTAVRRLMEALHKSETDGVGEEFAEGFLAAVNSYRAWEARQGTADSTVRSRCSHLRHAQRLLAGSQHAVPSSFATALDRAIKASGHELTWLAEKSGVPAVSLSQWRRGVASPGSLRKHLPKLEACLGLATGALMGALPIRAARAVGYGVAERGESTEFRQRLRRRMAEQPFSLREPTASLQVEWQQLLAFKTADIPRLHRERRAKWRPKAARMSKPLKPSWCCTLKDGNVVPSAHAAWVQIRQYLGWRCLDERMGGGGFSEETTQSLARLADADSVIAFVRWRAERASGLNMGSVTFLHQANSLLHPRGGWITQSPWLAKAAPELIAGGGTWAEHCARAFEVLKDFARTVLQTAKPTRDVEEALRPLLDTGNPIALLHDMLERMERDMPPATQPIRRATQQRDIALVTLLLANPLRIGQLCALEFGAGSDQNLRRREAGWQLHCTNERYKNGGTTMAKGLRVDLDESVTAAFDRYVREGREVLLAGRKSRLFFAGCSRWDPSTPCENLEDRLQILTARYIPGCVGFRGHGWRHLLATAWLMEHPGDFGTVADLLGDTVKTVAEKYRHIERASSVKRFGTWARAKRTD
jgi:integrase